MKSMKAEKRDNWYTYGLILLCAVFATFVMLPFNFINIPKLRPGDISPVDIRSPVSVKVEDVSATEKARKEARQKVEPIYKYNPSAEKELFANLEELKELSPEEKNILRDILFSYYKRGVISEVPRGYKNVTIILPSGKKVKKRSEELLKLSEIENQLKDDLSHFLKDKEKIDKIASKIAQVIKPNYVFQKEKTETLWKEAESKVKPVYITLQKGEIIVKKGEKVSPEVAKKIEILRKEKSRGKELNKYLSIFLLSIILFFLMVKLYKITSPSAFNLKNVIFSFSIVTLDIFLIRGFTFMAKLLLETLNLPVNEHLVYVPVVTSTVFASMFITKKVATIHTFPVAIIPSFILSKPELFIIPVAIGSIFSCIDSRKYRDRNAIYKSALSAGIVISILQILLLIYKDGLKVTPEIVALPALAILGSLITGIVVNGLSPLLIYLFKFSTDMVYMELINLDHPLLRKFILKAPGTYNHSVMVATLAEAAAEAIGANALLAKAGGLFHDIGKLKNPQAFVENQLEGVNIHDKLPPEKSAAILRAHVEYGEELGRKYKLPERIIDIIKQHHGTKLMKYFYHKAKEMYGEEKVDEKKFRYPGPKPQFKEAGIVMLADTVEAAIRSMKDKSNFNLDEAIHKLIMETVEDGQLNQSGLSLKDISMIEKVFKKVLSGIYHNRIEYPDETDTKENSKRN
jgi:putative nucleotidyltransferase with HDIG domain